MHRLPILLTLLAAGPVLASEPQVMVYQLSGAVHCLEREGIAPEKAADFLRAQGVAVIAAERRMIPLEAEATCGAPTGEANVVTIAAPDWTAFVNQHPDAGDYGVWIFDADAVEVYKYDGSLQCGLGRQIPAADMAAELAAAGIEVHASRKTDDGRAHIAVCGASTGTINAFTIPRGSLDDARRLGFRLLVTRDMIQQIKPTPSRESAAQQSQTAAGGDSSPKPTPLLW
jgi:hypothetical protein